MSLQPAQPTYAIEFANVRKRYAGATRDSVTGVSFTVAAGSAFGLAGVNGAGKSSLVKCLLDLTDATSGTISLFGQPSTTHIARHGLSFLPERFTPAHYLTGRDFLTLAVRAHGKPYVEAEARQALAALDLANEALDKPVRTYSKGMTQKLGLASCVLAQPRLMVLDEPMSGLDPKARAAFKGVLQGLKPLGTTLFFTSHALADIDEVCDTMAIVHEGQLRYHGAPALLKLKAPDNCRP
jgi:ABC-2 type transport system ATP-binding protein